MEPAPTAPSAAPLVRRDLVIEGMTCASCVRRVERALRATPGVQDAAVNFATATARVHYDGDDRTARALVEAVERAGYAVPGAPGAAPERAPTPGAQGRSAPGPAIATGEDAVTRAARRDAARDAEQRRLRRDVVLAAALTVPLLVLAMSHGLIPGADGELGRAMQLALASGVVLGPGRRFFRLAALALRHRTADMNTLVALGAGTAWLYSAVAVVAPGLWPHAEHGHRPHVYFEAAAAILTFVLLGKLLETRARRRLGDSVRALVALQPPTARLLDAAGDEREVPATSLRPGDRLRIRPGERVPADGTVITGAAAASEALLTGESLPVDKAAGAPVLAGALIHGGTLTVEVTRSGADSTLHRMAEAVEEAQAARAPIARLTDRVSAVFVPVVLAIAAATLLAWWAVEPTSSGLATAIERFVAVLVIACPCALGLATPAAVAVGTGRGAELGVLIRGGAVLETASQIDTVLLDKTGTLTAGTPALTDVLVTGARRGEHDLLSLAASAELPSEHPVAAAVVRAARERGAAITTPSEFSAVAGLGVEALVAGSRVRLGTAAWLEQAEIDPGPLEQAAERLAAVGRTPSFVAVDGALAGLLAVADPPLPEARAALARLADLGVTAVMVSGDRRAAAEAVAAELGIHRVIAEARPDDKARVAREARAAGAVVAMVGDGVNDAPALAAADVGVAIGSGTDVAIATADIALLRGGIAALPVALELSRATLRTIRQNLAWAFGYNVLAIPVAAGALYHWTGWLLSPVLASAAMSLSSVSVLLSSLRLRRFGRGRGRRRPALPGRARPAEAGV